MNKELSGNDLSKVKAAATLLTQNLKKHITIPELSLMVNLPENKLKAGFMELYGCGAYKYLTNARLEIVKELLFQDLPLKSIALEVGYTDKGSLIKAFRIQFGVTPGKWKKQHANALKNTSDPDHFTYQVK